MHIVLVYPEAKMWPLPSLGLLYVASMLECEHHKVEIFDCSREYFYGRDAMESFILFLKERPDVKIVAFGVNITQTPLAYDLAHLTKKLLPEAMVVFGGINPTFLPELIMQECKAIDVIVRHEAEYPMRDIAACKPLKTIHGLTIRTPNGLVHTPDQPFIQNLDDLPFLAWHLIDMEYYVSPKSFDDFYNAGSRLGAIMTSRGCKGRCNFCAAWRMLGSKPRYHSVERICKEIEHLVDTYNVELINFQDDNMLSDFDRTKAICEKMIKKGLNRKIKWFCNLTAATVKPDALDMLADAGCYQIGVGFESFASQTLKDMHKSTSYNTNFQTVKTIKNSRIRCLAYFMSGYRNEPKKDIIETQNMQKYCALELPGWTHYIPLSGSKDFDDLSQKGQIGDYDWITYDMAQNAISLNKRNYSAVPYEEYLSLYLSHIENYHFIRRCINGIELRTLDFEKKTSIRFPSLTWQLPGVEYVNDYKPLREALNLINDWDLSRGHQALKKIEREVLPEHLRRIYLEAMIYIHLIRVEDSEANEFFNELIPLLEKEEVILALARGNCTLGNYHNALRILWRALTDGPGLLENRARILLAYIAMLMGRPEIVQEAVSEAILTESDKKNLAIWNKLKGTQFHKGLSHIFKRYEAKKIHELESYASELNKLIAPHRYRFLNYYIPLRNLLREKGILKLVLYGFNRWSRHTLRYLKETKDFELLGLIEDRVSKLTPFFEGISILSTKDGIALANADDSTAMIISTDIKPKSVCESLSKCMRDVQIFQLFPGTADMGLLPSMTREIHGSPIHKYI